MGDTAGQEDYKQLRTTTYSNTDIFMICFSVVHPSSYENIKWWLLEVQNHCPDAPFVLCGTKIDLRDDPATIAKLEANGEKPITSKIGHKKAKEIKARAYLECSAKDFSSVASVFRRCTQVIMDKDKKMWADVHKRPRRRIRRRPRCVRSLRLAKRSSTRRLRRRNRLTTSYQMRIIKREPFVSCISSMCMCFPSLRSELLCLTTVQ